MALKLSLGKKFLLSVGSVVTLTIALLFVFIFRQSEQAIMDQVDHQSRAQLRQLRIIPLRVDSSCLPCHGKQGYREGEIRGGLSVMIPTALTDAELRHKWIALSVSGFVILAVVGLSLYLILRKLVLRPIDHLRRVASRLLAGDYSARAHLKTGDELEGLGHAYNAMTKHILASLEGMVVTLASAIEARDPYTAGHVERVSAFVKVIAEDMGIESKLKHQIVMGAILHDIGKIGIPDNILQKPGALNAAESATMRSHVNKGAEIVASTADFSASVQSAVLSHHEHFDGTGYPQNLKGDDIPIGDRIIAVADAFDAMTTDRSYHKGMSREAAVAQLKKLSGTNLDPKVVEIFLHAFEQGKIS